MRNCKQQCYDATSRPAPHWHVPQSAIAALGVDPFGCLGSQAIDLLCFLCPHSLPMSGSGIAVAFGAGMGIFPFPPLLLLVSNRCVHSATAVGGLIDRTQIGRASCRERG